MTRPPIRFRNGPKHLLGSLSLMLMACMAIGAEFHEHQFSTVVEAGDGTVIPMTVDEYDQFVSLTAVVANPNSDVGELEVALVVDREAGEIYLRNFGLVDEHVIIVMYIDADGLSARTLNQMFMVFGWVEWVDRVDVPDPAEQGVPLGLGDGI